jgi:hypothetical protein
VRCSGRGLASQAAVLKTSPATQHKNYYFIFRIVPQRDTFFFILEGVQKEALETLPHWYMNRPIGKIPGSVKKNKVFMTRSHRNISSTRTGPYIHN